MNIESTPHQLKTVAISSSNVNQLARNAFLCDDAGLHDGARRMSLSFNPKTGDYVIVTNDKKRAEDTGLTRSTKVRGPAGEDVYFSQDGYAALNYFKEADDSARGRLQGLAEEYRQSWAIHSPNVYPCGQADNQGRIKFRDYQNAGIDYALARSHCLIGDEMGIGKTATSIGVANASGAERILVVCPASIRNNWRREIKLWSTIPQVRCHRIGSAKDGVASWPHYTVISYELARNPDIHAALRGREWDQLIVDEAHFLKSHNAERTRALFGGGRKESIKEGLMDRVKRTICMTGTPIPNRPRECYTLAKALNWEAIDWASFDEFCYRYNPSARMGNGHIEEAQGRLPELHARLRCNFMIRRLKKDVIKELPDKQYEFAYVDADGTIRDIIKRERMLDFDPKRDLKDPNSPIWGQISTLRREMGEAKLPRVVEHLRYLMDIEEVPKLVVFSHHRSVMDGLKNEMQEYGVVEYRGGMGDRAKDNSIMQFQTNKDIRIFSGQLDAAGFGINGLQNVASVCVFAEPAWVPGANDQAVDRIHRLGQQFPVLAQFLIAEGSLDERVLKAVLDKTKNIHATLDAVAA